jgi:transposase
MAMANVAMAQIRRTPMRDGAPTVRSALCSTERKALKQLMGGMRHNPSDWSRTQTCATHWMQQSALKRARAWRLKMCLREVYATARAQDNPTRAGTAPRAWLSRARRSRLEPSKKLAATISDRLNTVVRAV